LSVNRNTLANLAGRIVTAALGILLIPVYVQVLGMESYALVGFFGILQSLFGLIDFGFGAAFSREIARLSVAGECAQEQRDLLATLNTIYWILAAVSVAAIWLLAPLIATGWLNASALEPAVIVSSVRMMGITIALQFPTALYQGGLLGLQRQVAYNVISVVTTTVRAGGAIVLLWFISHRIDSFFLWQAVLTLLAVAVYWIALDRFVPGAPERATFRGALVQRLWLYAAGFAGNTIGIAVAQQSDKIILSKSLTLEQFGYYTLASTAAALLWTLVSSVSTAVYPRLNQLVALGDEAALAAEYDRANQLLAVILLPVSMLLLFFAKDIMTVWTHKPLIATRIEALVICFTLGMALLGLVNIALHVALSYGWFRLTLGFTWGTALVSAPLFWFASRQWGVAGAAGVWLLQNAAYLLLIPILHRRYIPGGGVLWLKHAFLFPALVCAVICVGTRLIAPSVAHPYVFLTVLAAAWAASAMGVVFVEPALRAQLFAAVAGLRTAREGA
jgi:O-antigen/teichoic acid export membrane protein